MKVYLKALCVYLLLGFIDLIFVGATGNISYLFSNYMLEANFFVKFGEFYIKTIPFIITILFCANRMQKKGEPFFIRLIPFYLGFGIILSALITSMDLSNVSDGFYSFTTGVYSFIQYSNFFILPITILENLNPNNVISRFFKIGGYIAVAVSAVLIVYLYIKIFMVSKLPNVYGYDGFNFASVAETLGFVTIVVAIAIVAEILFIIIGYISNYAFEAETIESESLSYDELLKQADQVAEQKRQELYGNKEVTKQIDRSVSESTGMMNINNQLTQGSNVGQVTKSSTPSASLIESAIPTSSGPVVNSTLSTPKPASIPQVPQVPKQTQTVNQAVSQVPQTVAQTVTQQPNMPQAPTNINNGQ